MMVTCHRRSATGMLPAIKGHVDRSAHMRPRETFIGFTESEVTMSQVPEFCHAEKGDGPNRRARANETQRERRKRLKRLDFYASPEVIAVIDSLRVPRVGGDASSILNRIVKEWVTASGIIGVSRTRAGEG